MAVNNEEVDDWLGSLSGSASEAASIAKKDAAQRKEAANSVILNAQELLTGKWDSGKLLKTTIGGKYREITANDLVAFKKNIETAKNKVKKGITAKHIIDFSTVKPSSVNYTDLHLANTQIKMVVAVGAAKGRVRFITNASEDSIDKRHHVIVDFLEYGNEASSGTLSARKSALRMRKGNLKIECDCGKWRFWYRYIASIGGYNAGRIETGFPKIRNPNLSGIACKHIVRTVSEIEKGRGQVFDFLVRLLDKAKKSDTASAAIRASQKDAEKAIKNQAKRTTGSNIKSSEQKKAERALKDADKPKRVRPNSNIGNATDKQLIDELIKRGLLPKDASMGLK